MPHHTQLHTLASIEHLKVENTSTLPSSVVSLSLPRLISWALRPQCWDSHRRPRCRLCLPCWTHHRRPPTRLSGSCFLDRHIPVRPQAQTAAGEPHQEQDKNQKKQGTQQNTRRAQPHDSHTTKHCSTKTNSTPATVFILLESH